MITNDDRLAFSVFTGYSSMATHHALSMKAHDYLRTEFNPHNLINNNPKAKRLYDHYLQIRPDYNPGWFARLNSTLNLVAFSIPIDNWQYNPHTTNELPPNKFEYRFDLAKHTNRYFKNLADKFNLVPSNLQDIKPTRYIAIRAAYVSMCLEEIGLQHLTTPEL